MDDLPLGDIQVAIKADTTDLERSLEKTSKLGLQFGRTLTSAFEGVALKGTSLGDTINSLGLKLSSLAFRAAFKPLEQGIGSLFGNLLSGAGGAMAQPGVAAQSMPTPFAKGGVIAAPVAFPFGQGVGLAGERGAEAIMPLARGPDGRLGVAASGTGGAVVTFNITSPDADSFRRSEAQLSAMLARAVGQGQRNL